MLNVEQALREEIEKRRNEKLNKITQALLEKHVINKPKKTLSGQELKKAILIYREELAKQTEKGSTGSLGKFMEVLERCLMHSARNTNLDVWDLSCRGASEQDMYVYFKDGKKRLPVEVKTNSGCLASAPDAEQAWAYVLNAVQAGKWIAWAFQLDKDIFMDCTDPWNVEKNVSWIFLPMDKLIQLLDEYPLGWKTWFKTNESENRGAAVNWQEVGTSQKKIAFLWDLYEQESYDFQHFRDCGELRKVSER